MGGVVRLGPQFENLCRAASPDDRRHTSGAQWVVEAQGVPNLVHELVHAHYCGRLADDHGFDYALIPLDLSRRSHRRYLWEELACCAASCVVCAPVRPAGFARAWFCEQFEIQGVFYGFDDDLPGLRARVDGLLRADEHWAECAEVLARGRAQLRAALTEVGGPALDLPGDLGLAALWADYRASW